MLPMSKQTPLLLRSPLSVPIGSNDAFDRGHKTASLDQAGREAERHRSVSRSIARAKAAKGPPPTMSVSGSKVPGGRNSRVVPTASPTASPSRHPRNRSCTAGTSATPLTFAGYPVVISIHLSARAIPNKEGRLFTGSHVRAMGTPVAVKFWRLHLGRAHQGRCGDARAQEILIQSWVNKHPQHADQDK